MYKATKQWHLNEFVNLFVMEGVLYFLLYVFVPIASSPSPLFYQARSNGDFA